MFPTKKKNLKLLYEWVLSAVCFFLWCLMLFILLKLENRTVNAVGWDEMEFEEQKSTSNNFLTYEVTYNPLLNPSFKNIFKGTVLMLLPQKQCECSRLLQDTRISPVGNVPSSKKRGRREFTLETC